MITLETQLLLLAQCGIQLNENVTIEDLLREEKRQQYEKEPFEFLLPILGDEIRDPKQDKYKRVSNAFWHLDTECIDYGGDYVEVAKRMRDLAKADLPISNLKDKLDYKNKVTWLEFQLNGTTYKWDLEVNADWIDAQVLSKFASLLNAQNTGRRYTYLDLDGQDCLIGCFTEDEFTKLREITGKNFEWLT